MKLKFLKSLGLSVVTVSALLLGSISASAQSFPDKSITLMVGFKPGGSVDTIARALAASMQAQLDQPVVVVNKAGASGTIAARDTLQQAADGYTLYITNASSMLAKVIGDGADSGLDPIADFAVLGTVGLQNTGLFVPMSSPFQTTADLIAFATANPGELRWAGPGAASLHSVAGFKFLSDNGLKAVLIPFKGGSKTRNAVAGEQVDFAFMGLNLSIGFEEEVRTLGMTAGSRDAMFPDVATFEEQGLTGMNIGGIDTVFAPADIQDDVRAALVNAIQLAAADPAFIAILANAGIAATYLDPGQSIAEMQRLNGLLSDVISGL